MPPIHSLVMEHIRRAKEDARLSELCHNLHHVTQAQFGISPRYQDSSIRPYYSAISTLKSLCMSMTPTRQISRVVRAAKFVFERLNSLTQDSGRDPPGAGKG